MIFDDQELSELQSRTTSLAKAMECTTEARVLCSSKYPNEVVYANKAWSDITGYQQHEIAGKNMSLLQGPFTNKENIKEMMHNLNLVGFASAAIINYNKLGKPFSINISIEPIITDDIFGTLQIGYYLGKFTEHETINSMNQLYDKMKMSKERQDEYDWVKEADRKESESHKYVENEMVNWLQCEASSYTPSTMSEETLDQNGKGKSIESNEKEEKVERDGLQSLVKELGAVLEQHPKSRGKRKRHIQQQDQGNNECPFDLHILGRDKKGISNVKNPQKNIQVQVANNAFDFDSGTDQEIEEDDEYGGQNTNGLSNKLGSDKEGSDSRQAPTATTSRSNEHEQTIQIDKRFTCIGNIGTNAPPREFSDVHTNKINQNIADIGKYIEKHKGAVHKTLKFNKPRINEHNNVIDIGTQATAASPWYKEGRFHQSESTTFASECSLELQ